MMERITRAVDAWEQPGPQLSARRAIDSALSTATDEERQTAQAICRVVYVLGITSAHRSAAGQGMADLTGEICHRLDALWLISCEATEA